ncbi:gll0992 [Gloeobacter violaceus PCC 7421]|uniref:Gll0992 protein n=2 Tax=Gloeobacter violaceus TaxID=33072 RepID=Q7NLX7_GLOVI|nr:gll0992 [Gloeobacter violaceus PCC 7421]
MKAPRRRAVAMLGSLLTAALLARTGDAQTTVPPKDKAIVLSLQKGGYVLFWRHPKTDPAQADTDTLNLDNIKAQRQLTAEGRSQAKATGESMRALSIPIGKVISSKYSRATEAAQLAGFANAELSLDVSEPQNVPPLEARRRAAELRKLLATKPAAGTNTLIVGHRPNLQDVAGKEFADVAEGEIVVFEPAGGQDFKPVARIPFESWAQWSAK